jgi:hypothetical protein
MNLIDLIPRGNRSSALREKIGAGISNRPLYDSCCACDVVMVNRFLKNLLQDAGEV